MTTPSRVLETAVDWLERAVPVVKAARVGLLFGVVASVAGAVMALVGFLLIGATGGWFVIVVPFVLALAVPALILWRTRATMASVIALPAAVRDLDDLDDDLRERLSDVQQASRERGGVRGAVRTVASLVSEVRGSLDDELAPFAAAVETLVPARLVFAALVLGLGVGAAVVGAVVLFLGLLL